MVGELYSSFIIKAGYFISLDFLTELHISILAFPPLLTDIFCYSVSPLKQN